MSTHWLTYCDNVTFQCTHEAEPIWDYFDDTMGHPWRHRRREALFPVDMSNMHARTGDELPRTNNSVEAWHHADKHWRPLSEFVEVPNKDKREQLLNQVNIAPINGDFVLHHGDGFTRNATSESSSLFKTLLTEQHWVTWEVLPTVCLCNTVHYLCVIH